MTPRTCWIIPAEGSKSEESSRPPVLPGIDGFFVLFWGRYCQKFYEKLLWNIRKDKGNPPP
jgi:hypothetical protein